MNRGSMVKREAAKKKTQVVCVDKVIFFILLKSVKGGIRADEVREGRRTASYGKIVQGVDVETGGGDRVNTPLGVGSMLFGMFNNVSFLQV